MLGRRTLRLSFLAWGFAFSLSFFPSLIALAQGPSYRVTRRIPIGGEGGWDNINVDPDARRLYVSRGDHVMVVDEDSGKLIGDIPNTRGVHGIAIAPELGKGFTSNGQTNTVTFFDLKTLRPISEIKVTGENPDSIVYDPQTKRVFTFNSRTNNATAIDATNGQLLGTVAVGGKPQKTVLDGKGALYVALEDKNAVVKLDTKTLRLVAGPWPLGRCEGLSGLTADTVHRRLFAACDKIMVVIDADTGKSVASTPIAGQPDGNGFDPTTGLVFATVDEGVMSIIHQDSPDKYSVVGDVITKPGAATMALDVKSHHVFTMTADFRTPDSPTPDNPRPRPQPIPGTFTILELAAETTKDGGGRTTARAFLSTTQKERDGYGLYSYLLFGTRATPGMRDRYLSILTAYLKMMDAVSEVEKQFRRSDINITYLLVTQQAPDDESDAEWLLNHYDFPRAERLLAVFSESHALGPYLVSTTQSLSQFAEQKKVPVLYLFQNLSTVEPNVAVLWIEEFKKQAAQKEFWNANTRDLAAIKLRNAIAIGASAIDVTRKSASDWEAILTSLLFWREPKTDSR
jgi:DNA-binding beta-propeller fold protein YncE